MVLAYEVLRSPGLMRVHGARTALWNGGDFCGEIACAVEAASEQIRCDHRDYPLVRRRASRLLRARLALLLRVMLRVDAGDVGPARLCCTACGWSEWREERPDTTAADRARWHACAVEPLTWGEPVVAPWAIDRRIRPLWQIAAREAGR